MLLIIVTFLIGAAVGGLIVECQVAIRAWCVRALALFKPAPPAKPILHKRVHSSKHRDE